MTTEIVKINASDYGLEEQKAKQISDMFKPMLDKMVELEKEYNEVIKLEIKPDTCIKAKELRLKYVKVRTGTATIHKELKQFYLQGGRFVDGWKNAQLMASQGIEENLSAIEEHFERIEAEKIAKLQDERSEILKKYQEEDDFIPSHLGQMAENIWNNYLLGVKTAHEQKLAAEKAAKEAEEKRIAEEKAEQERIRKENERLKIEAEKREKAAEAERKKQAEILAKQRAEAEAKQKAIEEANRLEREKAEAERKKLEAELQAKKQAELKEKQRIEAEQKAKKEADKKAALAPDKDKLKNWINSMNISPMLNLKPESTKIASEIFDKFESFKKWALQQIELL